MSQRSLTRFILVLVLAATMVVGQAVAVHAAQETTYTGSVDELEAACADSEGAFIEVPDGDYGICVYEGGLSVGCDDFAIEGEDNCWIMVERKVPKETRQEFNEIKDAVGDLEPAGKPPKRVQVLVNVLEVVTQPGYCDKKLSRRTRVLQELLVVALLEGDRGFETCGSSESTPVPEPGGSPDRRPSSTSSSSTSSSSTSSSTTSSTNANT